MALKTVSELKGSISRQLQGIVTDKIANLDGAIEQAARTVIQEVSIPEASGRLPVTLYNGVYDYVAPGTIFGTSLLDFRPTGDSRGLSDKVYKQPIGEFDRLKHDLPNGYKLSFEYQNGTGRMRVASPKPTSRVVLDSIDDETSWTASGQLSSLSLDETDFYQSAQSFRFQLTGSGLTPIGTLTKAIDSVDLSDYEDVGVGFIALELPSTASFTSIKLKLGSSSANYNEVTATTAFLGAFAASEWQLVPFDFSTATQTGTPDWSAIDYAQINMPHTAALVNVRIGALFISLPSPHELIYETAAIFLASGSSTPSQSITQDSDQIILSDPAYALLEKEVALQIAQDEGGTAASAFVTTLDARLYGSGNKPGLYSRYRGENPPSRIKEATNYYQLRGFKRK